MTTLTQLKARAKSHASPKLWRHLSRTRHSFKSARKVAFSYFEPLTTRLLVRKLKFTRRRQINNYFANVQVRKLHLGSGDNLLPGWLNSDAFVPSSFTHALKSASRYIFLDVCQPFPIENDSVDYIFHEHVIEHLNYHQGQFMLKECFRILKPGGRIRIATPDLQVFVRLYGEEINTDQQHYLNEYVRFNSEVWSADLAHARRNQSAFVINHALRAWGHQFIYDLPTLSDAAKTVGFVETKRVEPQISDDGHLSNLEFRKDFVGIFDALIVEAKKPQ
jgi:predicted SAM-dependent methyltransferase